MVLLSKIGRTVKRFDLTEHRSQNPKKHAEAMTILRISKEKTKKGMTDVHIADAINLTEEEDGSIESIKGNSKILSKIKHTRYNKLKRKKN